MTDNAMTEKTDPWIAEAQANLNRDREQEFYDLQSKAELYGFWLDIRDPEGLIPTFSLVTWSGKQVVVESERLYDIAWWLSGYAYRDSK